MAAWDRQGKGDPRSGRLRGFVYGIDVEYFRDADRDGHGDLKGVIERLDHVAGLGATVVWLLPFYPHEGSDNGYDVTNHFAVDPLHGSMADFLDLLDAAHARGLRVMVDLVLNHTSNNHPWFRRSREGPGSPYWDHYVWRRTPPPRRKQREPIFPTVEPSVWTYDRKARAYYHHLYYRTQPDLNVAHPDVRRRMERLLGFWLGLGVDGVRIDSANHLVEDKDGHKPPGGVAYLERLHEVARRHRKDPILLGEADEPAARLDRMFGGGRRIPVLLNFYLDSHLFLAFAREQAGPIVQALGDLPRRPPGCQWLNCLRNLDELDLERLDDQEQGDVFDAFAPSRRMLAYDRGIRRRLAPMLGDPRRLRMAHALLFALPGVPLLAYGDEIGMGDDLRLEERKAVRIPMQWTAGRNAGFSQAPPGKLHAKPLARGPFGHRRINVEAQRGDPRSLLNLVRRLARLRTAFSELAECDPKVSEAAEGRVLVLRYPKATFAANLSGQPADVGSPGFGGRMLLQEGTSRRGQRLALAPYGFAWIGERRASRPSRARRRRRTGA